MENNENFVVETENVEQTTEQTTPKMFTQEEVNEIVGKSKARTRAKVEKEFEKKYAPLMDTLMAGTGKETVEEVNDTFREFYEKKGVKIPEKPQYSDRDIEVLAKAEAEDIIRYGFEEVVEEVDRLAQIGVENMTARDKAVFRTLAEYRQSAERGQELSKLGVKEDVYTSKEFNDFAKMFHSSTPISEIYNLYSMKNKPKKEVRTMGSMKNQDSSDNGVKEFYTRDEAMKFTQKDFDKNPALFKAVRESMYKWK
jgi:hypothetical protein